MLKWLFAIAAAGLETAVAVVEGYPPGPQLVLPQTSAPPSPFTPLNFSSASPQIFHSTFALLHQWPNTFFSNGHTIVPGTIRAHTKLYHARVGTQLPTSPEWLSLDAKMSFWIAGSWSRSHLLTYQTTRDVPCLYFDGTSAALTSPGSMDSQMLLIYNASENIPEPPHFRPPPKDAPDGAPMWDRGERHCNPLRSEYERAAGLCSFIEARQLGGLGWGYEGIVRMNAAFEVIWCNFSSPSLRLVSHLHIGAPELEGIEDDRPPWGFPTNPPADGVPPNGAAMQPDNGNPFLEYASYDWFKVAAKRYGFHGGTLGQGETRITLSTCTLFSLYDAVLEDQARARVIKDRKTLNLTADGHWQSPSHPAERAAALTKLMRRREAERANKVSVSDGQQLLKAVAARMRLALDTNFLCSGVDWVHTAREIVTGYAMELFQLQQLLTELLNETDHPTVRVRLANVRNLVHSIYMPFYEYPALNSTTLDSAFRTDSRSAQAALHRCTSQYHVSIDGDDDSAPGSGNAAIQHATHEVLASICGTVLPIHLTVERQWLPHFNNVSDPPPSASTVRQVKLAARPLLDALQELMAWLGWADQWTGCDPGCVLGELCYIPVWPLILAPQLPSFHKGPSPGSDRGYEAWDDAASEERLWEPRCVDAKHFQMHGRR